MSARKPKPGTFIDVAAPPTRHGWQHALAEDVREGIHVSWPPARLREWAMVGFAVSVGWAVGAGAVWMAARAFGVLAALVVR